MEKENDKKIEENSTSDLNSNEEKVVRDEEILKPSLEEKLKETHEKLLRTMADSENQRRRSEKETKEAFEYGGFNFARETLSLLDNLQRAHQSIKNDESLKDSKDLSKFLENIQIIEKDLMSIFEKNNIKKIDCLNKKFNPNNHQAMLELEDENVEPGIVLQEIQPGYFFKDRLLRPSFVAVSKKKVPENEKLRKKSDSTLAEK
ncbi:nucleotide exchange factor GrpE [Pelagibacteraceae bacterium]|nr:nucleotide exchange factor GrpE [Pelagibacteraceae bacterium]